MDPVYKASITSWTATSLYLELRIWIEPWRKSASYRREFTSSSMSYASKWMWLDGGKDSGQNSQANEELQQILDSLVVEHEFLSLFCEKYGIGTETHVRN